MAEHHGHHACLFASGSWNEARTFNSLQLSHAHHPNWPHSFSPTLLEIPPKEHDAKEHYKARLVGSEPCQNTVPMAVGAPRSD